MMPWIDKDSEEIKPYSTQEVWKEMERLVELGLAKSIGVSNCGV